MVRLMSRESQLAVAAARLAMADAGLRSGERYAAEDIGLYGATGTVGLPLQDVLPLMKASLDGEGRFDLGLFGEVGLRTVNPLLSFKILSNMPLCFVSLCENIQGPNAVFTPWEGQGAQAIAAGIQALREGDVSCVLVGGSDAKTHELAFISLEQQGLFRAWKRTGKGLVPGEGAAYLVLERAKDAEARGARSYARITHASLWTSASPERRAESCLERFGSRVAAGGVFSGVVGAANGDEATDAMNEELIRSLKLTDTPALYPKKACGELFAAATPLQLGMAALLARRTGGRVLALSLGHGSEQGAFEVEAP